MNKTNQTQSDIALKVDTKLAEKQMIENELASDQQDFEDEIDHDINNIEGYLYHQDRGDN